jgi:Sulfatase-modifying factor enzyme 1
MRAAASLIVLLCFSGPGLIRKEAIAQDVMGQHRWRVATGSIVLTVEEEKAKAVTPGSDFKECSNGCPVMIVVPAGKFIMGAPKPGASDQPQHEVTIGKPFAVSKFEVTFEEWDACVAAAACPRVRDHWGRGQMPVTNVSWGDAKQYVGWLSRLNGQRIPAFDRGRVGICCARRHNLPLLMGRRSWEGQRQLRWLWEPMGSPTDGARRFVQAQRAGALRHARERLGMG